MFASIIVFASGDSKPYSKKRGVASGFQAVAGADGATGPYLLAFPFLPYFGAGLGFHLYLPSFNIDAYKVL